MKTNINIDKSKLILLVVIVVSLFFAYKVWQIQVEKVNSLKNMISEEETKIEVLTSIQSLNQKIDSYAKVLKKEDVASMITKINNFASSTGIEIISIQPQREEFKDGVYKILPINLNINGTYHNIGRFISLLEAKEQFFRIKDFNLTSSRGVGEFGLEKKESKLQSLSCSLVLESIYLE
ncbi:MAG: type 4a pilus biogenesis protein PilO [Candidatus Omnitrophota bacterium]